MSDLLAPKLKIGIIHLGIILLVLIGFVIIATLTISAGKNSGRPFDISFLTGAGKIPPCGNYGHEGKLDRRDVREINSHLSRDNRFKAEDLKKWDVDGDSQITQADVDLISQYLSGQIQTFPACGEATLPQPGKRATCDYLQNRNTFKSTSLGGGSYVTDESAREILARPQDWTKKVGPLLSNTKWGLDKTGSSLDVNADGYVNATDAELIRQFLGYQFLNFPACPPPPPATDIVYPRKNDPNSHYWDDPTQRCWPYATGPLSYADAQMAQYFESIKGTDTLLPPQFQSPLDDLDADGRVTGLDLLVLKYPPWPVCQKQNYHPEPYLAPRAYAPKDCSPRGDINRDGRVTYDDVKTVFQLIRGEVTLTDQQQKAADVDGDGKITILDARYIYLGGGGGQGSNYAPSKWPVCGMPDLITPAPADSALFKLPPCRHLGDVNGDDEIDDYDAQHIFEYASGFTAGTQYGEPTAENRSDINGDDVVGVSDGRLIRQYLAGTIDTFAACASTGLKPGNQSH